MVQEVAGSTCSGVFCQTEVRRDAELPGLRLRRDQQCCWSTLPAGTGLAGYPCRDMGSPVSRRARFLSSPWVAQRQKGRGGITNAGVLSSASVVSPFLRALCATQPSAENQRLLPLRTITEILHFPLAFSHTPQPQLKKSPCPVSLCRWGFLLLPVVRSFSASEACWSANSRGRSAWKWPREQLASLAT